MNGMSDEFILDRMAMTRRVCTDLLKEGETLEFVSNHECTPPIKGDNGKTNHRLYYLGKAIEKLATCDYIAYIDDGQTIPRGCRTELEIADRYGIKTLVFKTIPY